MGDPDDCRRKQIPRLFGTALLGVVSLGTSLATGCRATEPPRPDPRIAEHLAAADEVATWLAGERQPTSSGVRWPVDADAAQPRSTHTLYSGGAGVILFFLEHFAASGEQRSLTLAQAGADAVWAEIDDRLPSQQPGLYTGLSGIAWMFAELHQTTSEPVHRQRAIACIDAVAASNRLARVGHDVISGAAGIGLAALAFDAVLPHPPARSLAARCGDLLLERARPSTQGTDAKLWRMRPNYPKRMPNFSHGTAGIAYFLAQLAKSTGEARYLDDARAGANHLLAATSSNKLIAHNTSEPNLFYLGWCHGPPGTSRLFTTLHQLTGDDRYRAWNRNALEALLATGVPTKRTPGFWRNHGQCCGTAGVVDYLMRVKDLQDSTRERHLENMFKELLDAATLDHYGMRWQTAERRVRPELRTTQTGYTQGAAGIGLLLLHDVARRRGAPRRIVFPDSRMP